MTASDVEEPEFVSEALAAGEPVPPEVHRLPEFLAPIAPSGAGLARLMQEVAEPPLRYAPFFERISRLWEMPEPEVERVLERSRSKEAWLRAPLPGLRLLRVGERGEGRDDRYLAHFAKGMRFPVHRHRGHEAVLLLEGSYTDRGGTVFRSGDLHEMSDGSEHAFVVAPDEPCIAAVRHHGLEFSSRWVRLLARFFDG